LNSGADARLPLPSSATDDRRARRPKLASLAATAYGLPALGVVTLLALLAFPVVFASKALTTSWSAGRIARHFIWLYGRAWMLAFRPLVRFEIAMPQPQELPRPCVVICNHLSVFDIYSLSALPDSDVSMVVRAWPFRMFWSAPFMRLAGYLDIERSRSEDAWERIGEILDAGTLLVFFPEGHRSRDGSLQRFRSGAFRAAVRQGAWVLPVCISGTDELLPPGGRLLSPATVRVHALEPVSALAFQGELAHSDMRKLVKARMSRELARMRRGDRTDGET